MIYTRDLFTSELFRVNLLSRNLVHCELPTELEALRESPELTVKTETVGYVNITSNWIGEIQQCFWSTQQPYGKIHYFNRQLLSSNILAYCLKICISIAPWLHVPIKNGNIINAGYWFLASRGLWFFLSFSVASSWEISANREGTVYFLKIAKINSQREKPMCRSLKN